MFKKSFPVFLFLAAITQAAAIPSMISEAKLGPDKTLMFDSISSSSLRISLIV